MSETREKIIETLYWFDESQPRKEHVDAIENLVNRLISEAKKEAIREFIDSQIEECESELIKYKKRDNKMGMYIAMSIIDFFEELKSNR